MSDESNKIEKKKSKSTVVRRKKNVGKTSSKELRQSMHEISSGMDDMNIGVKTRSLTTLKRSKSFHEDHLIHKGINNTRDILKQYVSNLQNVDLNGFEEHIPDESKEFPLHEIIEKRELKDLAVYLLRNKEKLKLEQKNSFGQTPLALAVDFELLEVVKLLITAGANVNPADIHGVTALRYAVEGGNFEIASLLIANGANVASVQNGF